MVRSGAVIRFQNYSLCADYLCITTYTIKMRSSSNPKIGIPMTRQIKLHGKSYDTSNGE